MRVSVAGIIGAAGLLAVVPSCSVEHLAEGAAHGANAAEVAPTVVRPVGPTARPVAPNPDVGAIFLGGGSLHTCSAVVVNSPAGDLIMTAAHCVADGFDATFVAGFSDAATDDDVWHVDAVYLDPRWIATQDPNADFAIARVSRAAGDSVQTRVGGGLGLGVAPKPGTVVTVTGYGMGVGGGPISCTAPIAVETQGFPSLPCGGLVDGMSGAPWVDGTTVEGIVGGLQGGGCDESVSYSPPFDNAVAALLTRAEAAGPADEAPTVFADDC